MVWLQLVTVLALLQYIAFGFYVGKARAQYGIKAPATSGNDMFERYNRVHVNTLETMVVFLPALWLAGVYERPLWVAGIGLVYLVGRVVYLRAYVANPGSRSLGYALSAGPVLILILITLIGIVRALIAS